MLAMKSDLRQARRLEISERDEVSVESGILLMEFPILHVMRDPRSHMGDWCARVGGASATMSTSSTVYRRPQPKIIAWSCPFFLLVEGITKILGKSHWFALTEQAGKERESDLPDESVSSSPVVELFDPLQPIGP